MIDIEIIKSILEQLRATGQTKVSLSDLAVYTHSNYQDIKRDLTVIGNYFKVINTSRAIYISLK